MSEVRPTSSSEEVRTDLVDKELSDPWYTRFHGLNVDIGQDEPDPKHIDPNLVTSVGDLTVDQTNKDPYPSTSTSHPLPRDNARLRYITVTLESLPLHVIDDQGFFPTGDHYRSQTSTTTNRRRT